MTDEELSLLQSKKEECLADFLYFTRYFFKDRYKRKFVIGEHHIQIAETLQKVADGEITRLIINIAPRFGKSELAVINFIAWGLAINPSAKFMHLSYSDDLALLNSDKAKEIVNSKAYQELFPIQIKKNRDSKKLWETNEGGGVYATSAAGQVTGFGAGNVDEEDCKTDSQVDAEIESGADFMQTDNATLFQGALIIDDPIKPDEADNELLRRKINERFDSTIINRINSIKTPIIIIMQRLHENDLCGHVLAENLDKWHVLSLPAIKEDGTALWPFRMPLQELDKIRSRNEIFFQRQYLQTPMPVEGRLYQSFKTYDIIPYNAIVTKCIIDTADTGKDFLCAIAFIPTKTAIYVKDIYYTPQGMQVTEGETAKFLLKNNVTKCKVESNNGGKAFARNVERISREIKNYKTKIEWFHQKDNKDQRIFSNAAEVENMIYYPADWEKKWPKFATAVKSYMATGGNSHDDAPDCLTLIIESELKSNLWMI